MYLQKYFKIPYLLLKYWVCIIDVCIDVMENRLYSEGSTGIQFAKLSIYLAEHFPHGKLQTLKVLLKGMSCSHFSILIIQFNHTFYRNCFSRQHIIKIF